MQEASRTYWPGLEFYRTSGQGLVGVENVASGNQSTYSGLTPDEARAWLEAFLDGRKFNRFEVPRA